MPADLVDDGRAERFQQDIGKFRQFLFQVADKGSHVSHIAEALGFGIDVIFGSLGLASVDSVEGRAVYGLADSFKAQGIIDPVQERNLFKVHKGEGCVAVSSFSPAAFHVCVADDFSKFCSAHGGLCAKRLSPGCILPAVARLHFLGGRHVACQPVQRAGRVQRCHKAAVKADNFKGRLFL